MSSSSSLYKGHNAIQICIFILHTVPLLNSQKQMRIHIIICLILTTMAFNPSNATKQTQPISEIINVKPFINKIYQWRSSGAQIFQETQLHISGPMVVAAVLCFIASSISSAGGIGGGGLFIPILTIVAGLDLKTASSLSAFMVTGGSLANVMCNMCATSPRFGGKSLINYDIALLSQPCILLGVSIGVICNLMFPEWLITILFALFLTWSTSRTCNSALKFWKIESENVRKVGFKELENGSSEESNGLVQVNKENERLIRVEEPLLGPAENSKLRFPWFKLGVLVLVWFSFFFLYVLLGNKNGQSMISIEPCGVGYWIISSFQIPLTVIFTAWIVLRKESHQDQNLIQGSCQSNKLIFPIMALLAGALGGVFGIGGGMLISPFLLQVGIAPEASIIKLNMLIYKKQIVTAATCCFMVLFSSTMSALQYLLLGMEHIEFALIMTIICFVASLVGLLMVQRAIQNYGRPSLIVFSISIVMALSVVLMTSFGAIQIWGDYISGRYMGFKLPC
ncbi:hypothetical protein Lal_00007587 [Lupinus albus]|uniref:Putative transmembrane protein TauE n=1 Tax=Lupinus albus TaxID=3870 RepID=A0A6A5MJ39_LUPAL|nr:putative transmembrane protein TauE [Lupinus albus]KAF1874971.1 hypothetical protein Lal_00007587 [Lupinus albus]